MVERAFETFDHTADAGIVAYGVNMRQLFTNAAMGLFNLVADTSSIEHKLERQVEIQDSDSENLLVAWLNELIYLFDAEQLLFSDFEIESLSGNCLKATCFGEKFDPAKHRLKTGVKAATYHMLKITTDSNGYRTRIIFDI